jgi:hypothetical protein
MDLLVREEIMCHAAAIGNQNTQPGEEFPIERAIWYCYRGRFAAFRQTWVGSPQTLGGRLYHALAATVLFPNGAADEIGRISDAFPAESSILLGVNMLDRNSFEDAFANLEKGLSLLRGYGVKNTLAVDFACAMIQKKIPELSRPQQERLFGLLEQPFQSNYQATLRMQILAQIATNLGGEYADRVKRSREVARETEAFATSPMRLEEPRTASKAEGTEEGEPARH